MRRAARLRRCRPLLHLHAATLRCRDIIKVQAQCSTNSVSTVYANVSDVRGVSVCWPCLCVLHRYALLWVFDSCEGSARPARSRARDQGLQAAGFCGTKGMAHLAVALGRALRLRRVSEGKATREARLKPPVAQAAASQTWLARLPTPACATQLLRMPSNARPISRFAA